MFKRHLTALLSALATIISRAFKELDLRLFRRIVVRSLLMLPLMLVLLIIDTGCADRQRAGRTSRDSVPNSEVPRGAGDFAVSIFLDSKSTSTSFPKVTLDSPRSIEAGKLFTNTDTSSAYGKSDPRPQLVDLPTATVAVRTRRVQLLLFTADWCQYCKRAIADLQPWLQRSGWTVSTSDEAHVRLIDFDREPELAQRFQVRELPTLVLLRDGNELQRWTRYPGREACVQAYLAAAHRVAVPETPPPSSADRPTVDLPELPAQAIPWGTLPGTQATIRRLLDSVRPLLAQGGTINLRIQTADGLPARIAATDRLTLMLPATTTMAFAMHGDALKCQFSPPFPRGQYRRGITFDQPASGITLSTDEIILELPRAPDLRWQVLP